MRLYRGATAAFAVLSMMLCFLLVATPAKAETAGCMPDVGKKLPVLFVHGLNAKGSDWDGFRSYLSGKNSDVATEAFDYSANNTKWVTDPNIGAALANKIACMAASSREQGGQGKVVVVAHSMGGLATRQAISEQSEILSDLGMVITIATPNTGASIALPLADSLVGLCNFSSDIQDGFGSIATCRSIIDSAATSVGSSAYTALLSGSAELEALAKWPNGLSVYAIAGDIKPHYNFFFTEFDGLASGTDTLVAVPSALDGASNDTFRYECTGDTPVVVLNWTKADCEHGALVNSQTVQQKVAEKIGKYIDSNKPKPSPSPSPSVTGRCMSTSEFRELVAKRPEWSQEHIDFRLSSDLVCQKGWVAARGKGYFDNGGASGEMLFIFNWNGSQWQFYYGSVVDIDSAKCEKLPQKISNLSGCS